MESTLAMKTLVFLGAAIIMVPLVRRLGLSSVIGYILGGIIIGPFVLKLSGNDTEDIMHATEFGVVMLLFLIGLELEPKKFWAMRKQILGLGLSQMLLTIGILSGIFMMASWRFDQAVTVAMCFAMSSTAIVLQTLSEKNMLRTAAGEASFSTLLFQDIAVVPILALLPLIAHHYVKEKNEVQMLIQTLPEWMQTFTVILGVAILILLGKYIFVPFLRYVSKSGMSELLTASSLFLVVGVSELMVSVGLSPALGAFLAGVMLANSEFRNELEAQIDPFKGLLLAVFFVSVGASINFSTIQQDPVFIFSMVFLVLAVKFAVLFIIGKFFGIETSQNYFYAFALSQVGEFAFVLLNYSTNLYLLDKVMLMQLTAITAITMCITPLLLVIHDKIISKRINNDKDDDHAFDIMDAADVTRKKVIIVGFGHFGSTVGRLLKASKVAATILDNDSERVKLLRSYGFKVYYGDATRLPVLEAAGIQEAEILVLCLDKTEKNKMVADMIRERYPNVKIFVRAKNRNDAYFYVNHGIDNVYRETLGTGVNMAVDVLHATGMRKYAARRLGKRFTLLEKASLKKLANKGEGLGFSLKESIQREQELLAYDSMNYNSHDLIADDDEPGEENSAGNEK